MKPKKKKGDKKVYGHFAIPDITLFNVNSKKDYEDKVATEIEEMLIQYATEGDYLVQADVTSKTMSYLYEPSQAKEEWLENKIYFGGKFYFKNNSKKVQTVDDFKDFIKLMKIKGDLYDIIKRCHTYNKIGNYEFGIIYMPQSYESKLNTPQITVGDSKHLVLDEFIFVINSKRSKGQYGGWIKTGTLFANLAGNTKLENMGVVSWIPGGSDYPATVVEEFFPEGFIKNKVLNNIKISQIDDSAHEGMNYGGEIY
jgi:hypothetical protein